MPATITVSGDREAAARLVRYGVDALHLRTPLDDAADFAAKQVTGIPERTGTLADSIEKLEVTDHGFTVGTEVFYGRFVFGGTKYMAARPPRVKDNPIARDAADRINRHLA